MMARRRWLLRLGADEWGVKQEKRIIVPALPGVMIFLTSMAFNLLSDGLRDAMDVRL